MPKKQLISYTGKMPVEIDFPVEIEAEKKRARKEKREPAFVKTEFVRSGALTLRKNNTALISKDELKIVKRSLGKRTFNRFVTEHGEHNPRSQRPEGSKAIVGEPMIPNVPRPDLPPLKGDEPSERGESVSVKPGKKGKGK